MVVQYLKFRTQGMGKIGQSLRMQAQALFLWLSFFTMRT